MYICIYVYLYRDIYVHVCVNVQESAYVCVHAYVCTWVHAQVLYMYMCIHAHQMRKYIHTHQTRGNTYTHTSNQGKYIGVPYVFVLSFQVDFMLNKI